MVQVGGFTEFSESNLARNSERLDVSQVFASILRNAPRDPQNDLATALISTEEAGDKLSKDELLAMVFLLLIAGHETTVNLIGNGMLALIEHPEAMDRLRHNPVMIKS